VAATCTGAWPLTPGTLHSWRTSASPASSDSGAVTRASARFSKDAAADGNGAWIVSTHPARLFCRNQAITALTLAERVAHGCGDEDPFVKAWRKELFL
jgi:hypothetical protein